VLDPIVGESIETNLDDLRLRRPKEVAFRIATRVLDAYFRAADDAEQPWLLPQLLAITKRWLAECAVLKDHAFPQMLLWATSRRMPLPPATCSTRGPRPRTPRGTRPNALS